VIVLGEVDGSYVDGRLGPDLWGSHVGGPSYARVYRGMVVSNNDFKVTGGKIL
jgi:hypothetical protein